MEINYFTIFMLPTKLTNNFTNKYNLNFYDFNEINLKKIN